MITDVMTSIIFGVCFRRVQSSFTQLAQVSLSKHIHHLNNNYEQMKQARANMLLSQLT